MNVKTENKQYRLYSKILDFNHYVRTYIVNTIPSVHRDLRIHLLDEFFLLTKNLFYATYNKGNIRMKYLIEIKVNLSIIDMLITEISNLQCMKKTSFHASINKLSDIKNIIYGLVLNEESKKK